MKLSEQISLMLYDIVVDIHNTLRLPTHDVLAKTFVYSGILFLVTLLANVLNFFTFLSWQGCLFTFLALGILLYIERRENDALSRMYRAAKVSAQSVIRRAKNAGSAISNRGSGKQPTQH